MMKRRQAFACIYFRRNSITLSCMFHASEIQIRRAKTKLHEGAWLRKTEMSLTFGLIICVHFETVFQLI